MNDKETLLRGIVEIGVNCCATHIDEFGTMSVSVPDVIGKDKHENILMTRCLIVNQIRKLGFSVETIATLFERSYPAVRNLLSTARQYHTLSYAYRLAENEMKSRLKERYDIE